MIDKHSIKQLRQDPIFITGLPRSGTTLIQALIATQKDIISFPETHYFNYVIKDKYLTKKNKIKKEYIYSIIENIKNKNTLSNIYEKTILELSKKDKLNEKDLFEIIVINYFEKQVKKDEAFDRFRWMEKTPNHIFYIDKIKTYYPKAKIIFMIRDPEKTILSIKKYSHYWTENDPFIPVEVYSENWLQGLKIAEDFSNKEHSFMKIIKLENFTKNPDIEMETICEFLNLSYEKDRIRDLNKIANKIIRKDEHWKINVSKNIILKDKILRENNHLTLFERKRMESVLQAKMLEYNYKLSEKELDGKDNYDKDEILKTIKYFKAGTIYKSRIIQLLDSIDDIKNYGKFRGPIKKLKSYIKLILQFYFTIKYFYQFNNNEK